jgi:hypothetical protein
MLAVSGSHHGCEGTVRVYLLVGLLVQQPSGVLFIGSGASQARHVTGARWRR